MKTTTLLEVMAEVGRWARGRAAYVKMDAKELIEAASLAIENARRARGADRSYSMKSAAAWSILALHAQPEAAESGAAPRDPLDAVSAHVEDARLLALDDEARRRSLEMAAVELFRALHAHDAELAAPAYNPGPEGA